MLILCALSFQPLVAETWTSNEIIEKLEKNSFVALGKPTIGNYWSDFDFKKQNLRNISPTFPTLKITF